MDMMSIRAMRQKVEDKEERIMRLRSAMELGNRQLRVMPGGTAFRDRLADDMARLDELERELVGEVADMEASILAAEQTLEDLPEQQQRIMRLRYIRGLS